MRSCALILTLIVAGHTPLEAQWPEGVTSGARVQVRLPEVQYQSAGQRGHLIRGRVTVLSPDTLYLSITDSVGALPIPRTLIDRLQLSRGIPSRLGNGLRVGAITGVVTSLLLVLWNEADNDTDRTSTGTAALVGAVGGFIYGGVMGAVFPTERWKKLRMDTRH